MANRKLYTADELLALKARIRKHGLTLFRSLPALVEKAGTFDGACELRNTAQHLCSTLLALQSIDTSIAVTEMEGKPRAAAFGFEDCGLERLAGIEKQEAEANARLFAAAPEMYDALEAFLAGKPQCECSDGSGCSLAAARSLARDAIAKAEGRA